MQDDIIIISIINWALGLMALICVITLSCVVPVIGIAAIVEGTRVLPAGQRRTFKITKVSAIISAVALGLLIGTLVLWGLATYYVESL